MKANSIQVEESEIYHISTTIDLFDAACQQCIQICFFFKYSMMMTSNLTTDMMLL